MAVPTEDDFRQTAVGYWSSVRNKSADDANAATAAGDTIVATWRVAGVATERLRRLLVDDSDEVRFAAAAHLGPNEPQGVAVLQELTTNPRGLVAPTARLLLIKWGCSRR